MVNPCKVSQSNFHDSEQLTSPLVALIIAQCINQTADRHQMHQLKLAIRKTNHDHQAQVADTLYGQLSPSFQCCVDLAKESGSSSWLTVLPIQEHGFHLHKGDFWNALSLRYGLSPLNTSKSCHCGASFSWTMPWCALLEVFLLSATMRYVI